MPTCERTSEGTCQWSRNVFFGERLTVKVSRTSTVYTFSDVIVRQVTGLLLSNLCKNIVKNRKENPQKLTQLSSRSHPRHLVGKRTAQKDITIDTTSDSQVNSNFPNRWSPASQHLTTIFTYFLYLYIT